MLAQPGSRLGVLVLGITLAIALASCATRGSHQEGWVTVSAQVRYRSMQLSGHAVRLEVAYLRAALTTDDAAQQAARDAFRRVAIDLDDPAFDPDGLALVDQTTPNGVREITVTGVVAP